jgi:hypothetical protein
MDRMLAPDRTYDPIRFRRGTRGFAAFVTGLNGFVVLGATLFVVPTLGLDRIVASWAVILGVTAGLGHLVAIVGLIRGRPWGASLVGYLAAAGIGVASFGALLAATGHPIFGAEPGTALGFFIWMIGSWSIASRFAFKPFTFTPHAHRATVRVARPAPDARPSTGPRKRTAARPAAAGSASRLPTPA